MVITRDPSPPEAAARIGIGLEVRAANQAEALPSTLQFRIVFYDAAADRDRVVEDVTTGVIDATRNLPRLLGSPSETFSITLTSGEFSWTEEFTI